NINRVELNQAIVEFRSRLRDPESDAKPAAQKLYNWLIKPIESDLKQANAQTIIYAPDAQLRYIPLQALHDGQQWLTQRYRVNNITAQSLTKFTAQPTSQPRLLAGAFASGKHIFQVGPRALTLSGLPFAGKEVEALATQMPNTKKLIDQDFSRTATTTQMNEFNIVHLATHAAFVPGRPKDSFIAFGNGDYATLEDISSWTLTDVDLIVLSACDTGLGGNFGNGEEILGLGYQFQTRGAKAAIASLWRVDDGGTQALMREFYHILNRGNVTRVEALRQAQISLIEAGRSGVNRQASELLKSGLDRTVLERISHPYYWSPFILIGNGL
ncbi:MAG: CHAT domain-containing protein, partial [Leptolyngbya sp. Prado105]|nr:CHAT domain-containing protein [Leptolyngbya sp. Prado105]